jgi:hypothetical protein
MYNKYSTLTEIQRQHCCSLWSEGHIKEEEEEQEEGDFPSGRRDANDSDTPKGGRIGRRGGGVGEGKG